MSTTLKSGDFVQLRVDAEELEACGIRENHFEIVSIVNVSLAFPKTIAFIRCRAMTESGKIYECTVHTHDIVGTPIDIPS